MIQLIERILQWLRGGSLKLLILAGVILLISGILSPIGTIVWWLSQEAENLGLKKNEPKQLQPSKNPNPVGTTRLNCYIVFLTGVGDFSTNELTSGEEVFLNGLARDHANCAVVRDVFPYSVANKSLGGERVLAPLWSFANEAEGWLGIANVLIKVRNLWRFAIAADERYGPVYNQGIASAIIDRMNAAQPLSRSRRPLKLIVIGTSGGGQVALGATEYLNEWLDAQIIVVSVGGVFNGIDGFDAANRVYHLWGSRDWVDNIGNIVFTSRWPLTFASPFNQALRQGRYEEITTGYHEHDGAEGYFGEKIARTNEIKYVDLTLQKVNQLPIWSMQKRDDVSSSD